MKACSIYRTACRNCKEGRADLKPGRSGAGSLAGPSLSPAICAGPIHWRSVKCACGWSAMTATRLCAAASLLRHEPAWKFPRSFAVAGTTGCPAGLADTTVHSPPEVAPPPQSQAPAVAARGRRHQLCACTRWRCHHRYFFITAVPPAPDIGGAAGLAVASARYRDACGRLVRRSGTRGSHASGGQELLIWKANCITKDRNIIN